MIYSSAMRRVEVFTDGGARNNPGIAGAGACIFDEKGNLLKEVSKYLGVQTNNWAEYEAVAIGLEAVKKLFGKETKTMLVEMKLDSELVVEQLSGRYQVKEPTLYPQFIKIHNLRVKHFSNITFTHIPREKNKVADRLANEAMDREA